MAKKDEFKLANQSLDTSITKDDFKLVSHDKKIYDRKFNTKPTTFLKDCVKRFAKNKSSVVAAFILGILILLSLIVPVIGQLDPIRDPNVGHQGIEYLEPKLFNDGDFWNGKKQLTNIAYDPTTIQNPGDVPTINGYDSSAIENWKALGESYVDQPSLYGTGGFVKYQIKNSAPLDYIAYFEQLKTLDSYNFDNTLKITNYVVYDNIALENSSEENKTFPETEAYAQAGIRVSFHKNVSGVDMTHTFMAVDFSKSQNIGEGGAEVAINSKFDEYAAAYPEWQDKNVTQLNIQLVFKGEGNKFSTTLIKSLAMSTEDTNTTSQAFFTDLGFENGTKFLIKKSTEKGYWTNKSSNLTEKSIYLSKANVCSFTYDTYQASLGKTSYNMNSTDLQKYIDNEIIKFICPPTTVEGKKVPNPLTFKFEVLNERESPFAADIKIEDVHMNSSTGKVNSVDCVVYKYKIAPYNLKSEPIFIMGTDKNGRDMFVNVFTGLRTSLLLGICTSAVCFVFGLIWGSISGYFGGAVDLIMERFTDILSGVPWIVVMTLVIIQVDKPTFGTFALALCLTGWIGTAATTRTQFYRFRSREYVLASRTLGASSGRLIAKHILPNAMGTIITSAVLMVPSVIFSEATLTFLGLAKIGDADSGIKSLGVILSDNQSEIQNHPYLLIFPSVIIALVMISCNLFGNGLRDAVNPSLKGEGE